MKRWVLFSLLGVALFAAAVLIWGLQSWTDAQPLVTPKKVAPQTASYRCSAPLSAAEPGRLKGSPPKYDLTGAPCSEHGQYRNLALIDLGGSVVAAVALVAVGRRRRGSDALPPVVSVA